MRLKNKPNKATCNIFHTRGFQQPVKGVRYSVMGIVDNKAIFYIKDQILESFERSVIDIDLVKKILLPIARSYEIKKGG